MRKHSAKRAPLGRQAPGPGLGPPPAKPRRPGRPYGEGRVEGEDEGERESPGQGPTGRRKHSDRHMKTFLYFAYGSNLDRAQMRRRCPTAAPLGPAALHGWRLAFGGHSRTWGGPVATIVPAREDRVDGLLYELPRAELQALDHCEGHPGCYRRRPMQVAVHPDGTRRLAQTYVLPVTLEARPALAYFAVIWLAYRTLGFDRTPLLTAAAGGTR